MNTNKNLSASHPTTCYAVLACRWGWINNGFDVLRVTADLSEATAVADSYADYRGGKYGVGVFDAAGKQIYHSASLHGEKELYNNYRIDTFERVGGMVCCALEGGEELDMDLIKRRWEQGVKMEELHSRHDV